MNSEKISLLLQQGENSSIEFKRSDVKADVLAREIVAFANTSGGTILLGVEDDGTVSGVMDDFNREEWVANICRVNVVPAIDASIVNVTMGIHRILAVEVPKGPDKPYQTLDGKYLVRIGSTNRTASQSELMRLFQSAGVFHFDLTGVKGTSVADINLASLEDYFLRYEVNLPQESDTERIRLLKNTDILTDTAEATVGGLLLFGNNPQRHLRHAAIDFAHFAGTTVTAELIDKQNIGGTLNRMVDSSLAVIKNNILNPSLIQGTRRVDSSFQYSDRVYRELLTNACVHRNYAISGSGIRVMLFSDRIEFLSPGKLPNTVTIDKLRAGVSYATNPVIVKFMENMRYIDKLGRGLPMVCQEAEKAGKRVEFEEIGELFKAALYY